MLLQTVLLVAFGFVQASDVVQHPVCTYELYAIPNLERVMDQENCDKLLAGKLTQITAEEVKKLAFDSEFIKNATFYHGPGFRYRVEADCVVPQGWSSYHFGTSDSRAVAITTYANHNGDESETDSDEEMLWAEDPNREDMADPENNDREDEPVPDNPNREDGLVPDDANREDEVETDDAYSDDSFDPHDSDSGNELDREDFWNDDNYVCESSDSDDDGVGPDFDRGVSFKVILSLRHPENPDDWQIEFLALAYDETEPPVTFLSCRNPLTVFPRVEPMLKALIDDAVPKSFPSGHTCLLELRQDTKFPATDPRSNPVFKLSAKSPISAKSERLWIASNSSQVEDPDMQLVEAEAQGDVTRFYASDKLYGWFDFGSIQSAGLYHHIRFVSN